MKLQIDVNVTSVDDAIDALEEIVVALQHDTTYKPGRFELLQPLDTPTAE
jgi:hypothetical protein